MKNPVNLLVINLVSVFTGFVHLVENKSIGDIVWDIQTGKYQHEVTEIRKLVADNRKEEADVLKKKLPAFTPSGTFNNGRKAELLSQYSNHVILDLDKLSPDKLTHTKDLAVLAPYTYAAFISPSGNGLKIIVPVDNIPENHKLAVHQVSDYYEQALELQVDPSGKDVSRLCFMSYDPECFVNKEAKCFKVNLDQPLADDPVKSVNELPCQTVHGPVKEEASLEDIEWVKTFNQSVEFSSKKLTYIDGNRNNYIHLLACNCNRAGIPETVAESYILQHFDLDVEEAKPTISSAYKNNAHDFAKFANFANFDKVPSPSKDELLLHMPFLPDGVFQQLPSLFKDGCDVFNDLRERDVFLTGALAILSGCMRNIYGVYKGKEVYANLFSFIIAPAASGKGSLSFAKQLGNKFHELLLSESQHKNQIYQTALAEYKRNITDKKIDISELEPPTEPDFKVLFIPANSSSARIIQHLKEGDECGIFCETEADTMGNVLKQDWGNYSDLLRKSFHHEPVSSSRKANKEWTEVKIPQLSVALSGTPGQVENLIKSAEDGLFSRFIFYTFKSDIIWSDVSPSANSINLTSHFNKLSERVLEFVNFMNQVPQITFELTKSQWGRVNEFGNNSLTSLATFVSEDLAGTAKRLGLILYRISMVITTLRYFDNGEISSIFICSDQDFELALQMIMVYQEHAVFMFNELPKNGTVTDKVMKSFFESLPANFHRKEAITIALQFDIKERTADLYLSKLVAFKWLEKTRSGVYQKLRPKI